MIDSAKLQTVLHSQKTKKYAWRFVIAFFVIGVLGFFVLPPLVKSMLLEQLGKALHRPVTVNSVSINPYALSVTLEGVSIQEREGGDTFASFDSLYLNLESTSIFRFGPVFGEVRLENPKLRIVRLPDNRYNFSDLLDEFMARPRNDDPTPPFSLNNIQITGGVIEFDDRPLDEKHVISDINLTLPFVSSMAYATDSFVEPSFSALVNGAPLHIKGRSKPFADTLESELALDLSDLQLAKYLDYIPFDLPIKVQSGALNTNLKLTFLQQKDKPSTLLVSGTTAIASLDVKDTSGFPLLSLKQLDLVIGSADLLGRKFVIERIAVDSPEIHARVSRQGTINWIEFFRKELKPGKPMAQAVEKSAPAIPVEWSLGEAKVSGGALRWLDESHGKPFNASLEALELDLHKLDSKGETAADFDASWRMIAEEWLKVESHTIKGGKLDLARHEVRVGDALSRGVRVLIRRTAEGKIEWLQTPALRVLEASQTETSAPWKITVDKYVGEDFGVRFEDRAVSPAATQTIDGFGIEMENLSTEPGQTAKLAARFKHNKKGEVSLDGTLKLFPLNADLNLDIKSLELLPLQAYFTEKLNISVTRGQVTMNGNVQVRQEISGKKTDAQVLAGGFTGQATIGDFYAVDKLNSADFLRWKSLFFGKVDARLNPNSLSIGEIALTDFFARVIVSPEGKLNLLQIVRKEDAPAVAVVPQSAESGETQGAAPATESGSGKAVAPVNPVAGAAPVVAESKPLMPIKIGKITLQGGNVRFSDNFVKPNYTANLKQIGGRITGLSSEPGSIASLELRGSYDNVAPLNVSAQINPLSAKPYLDLQADIKGIELTSFSSYSGKYAGYMIEKGKLSLFVKYKIENDQLEAENRIFLDQLTFGDPVASPDATKLPVTLAVSLLKNRKGEIDLNLPISGSLNDPQFSIGGLVIKVIINLFIKAVTSPFALIGSMFGSGEELSNVEFDYGRATITPAAQKRLENLTKALIDRPALKLEVEGRVDLEQDREGLKSARIERKVRALKREDLTKNGVESGSAETITVSDEEYPALLERAYRAEKFPKPRNMVGLVKGLPVEEMEKLMLANSIVDDEDLRELGERRAKAVRDWLLDHEVPADRVFLRPSKLGEAGAKSGADEKARSSRVDFTLK
ncbi:MAG: DUF748 domain-containing protein [Propionivibrio sp.]|uniref:DUF748 domain-containing protein n=1 Tax=Propionivibrio sp. TaxID=2212460 RepID=UPI001A5F3CE2|nr:DUF748 domain-containing protein [Propionivibrio sp.]MBL8414258.1 DUF748 domain-containing protein [Propionivibrio sp.]